MFSSLKKLSFRSKVTVIVSLVVLSSVGIIANSVPNIRDTRPKAASTTVHLPASGSGFVSGISEQYPNNGSNWDKVDDMVSDDDDTYVRSNISGSRDIYTHVPLNIPAGSVINSVTVRANTRVESATNDWTDMLLARSASDYKFGRFKSATFYQDSATTYTSNPFTGGSWAVSDVNALQVGISLPAGGRATLVGLNVTYTPPPPPPDTTKPSTPGNLQITGKTTTSISLGWGASSDNVGVAFYRVYRQNGTIISNQGDTTVTSFTVSGLSPATSYSYFVRAFDSAGNFSLDSNIVTTATNAVPPPPPPPPSTPPPSTPPPGGGTPTPPPPVAVPPAKPPGYGTKPPPANPSSSGPVSGILNTLKLKLSLPYNVGKNRLLFVIGGYSYSLEAIALQTDYSIDLRGAKFSFGKEIEVVLGGQFLMIKKMKVNPQSETTELNIGELPIGDLNKDNKINSDDTNILLKSVFRSNAGDVNSDGVTNSFDWSIINRYLGRSGD